LKKTLNAYLVNQKRKIKNGKGKTKFNNQGTSACS
jgi:hypothetical protein